MNAGIEVKHIKAYVQENGIIRLGNGKKKDFFLGRLIDDITYEEIEEIKLNPWDCVPDRPVFTTTLYRRKLECILNGKWYLYELYLSGNLKTSGVIAHGYNCDYSRSGEIKIFKDRRWIDD